MKVFVVLYKTNYGDGTSTNVDSVYESELDAIKYVEENSANLSSWEYFTILEEVIK